MNALVEAVKLYRAQHGTAKIPKKGTAGYEAFDKIYKSLKKSKEEHKIKTSEDEKLGAEVHGLKDKIEHHEHEHEYMKHLSPMQKLKLQHLHSHPLPLLHHYLSIGNKPMLRLD